MNHKALILPAVILLLASTVLSELGYPAHLSAKVRDLWQTKDMGENKGTFSAAVAPGSVVMVTVKP